MKNKNLLFKPKFEPPIDVTKKRRLSFDFHNFRQTFFAVPPKRRLFITGAVGLAVLIVGSALIFILKPNVPALLPEPQISSEFTPPTPTTIASPLTGLQVEPALAERAVTGVMIENSLDARPQSGLQEAGVVFEAIAEGGITRFLALYQESQPSSIGPIRSARPYYVQWAAGFDAAYAHSGGSPEALALIRSLGVKDLDHGFNPNAYERVTSRFAPHNVYTSMKKLDELKKTKGFTKSSFTAFKRLALDEKPEQPASEDATPVTASKTPATKISFQISGPLYNTSYSYDKKSNTYLRSMASEAHKDEKSGKRIAPSVVIALITDYSILPNGIHSSYKVVGSGDVLVFQNGTVTKGRWEKKDRKSALTFKQKDGKFLELMPGQTWITAIQNGRTKYTP